MATTNSAGKPKSATLNEVEAAAYLGISPSFLRFSRMAKPRTSGPPFCKIGKAVRYLTTDLDAWLISRRVGLPLTAAIAHQSALVAAHSTEVLKVAADVCQAAGEMFQPAHAE